MALISILLIFFAFTPGVEDKKISFVIFGRIYPHFYDFYDSTERINELNPTFVVLLGDSVKGKLPYNEAFDVLDSAIAKLNSEVLVVSGNPDVDYVNYVDPDQNRQLEFEKRYGKTSYFVYENNLFLFLKAYQSNKRTRMFEEDKILIKNFLNENFDNLFIFSHNEVALIDASLIDDTNKGVVLFLGDFQEFLIELNDNSNLLLIKNGFERSNYYNDSFIFVTFDPVSGSMNFKVIPLDYAEKTNSFIFNLEKKVASFVWATYSKITKQIIFQL